MDIIQELSTAERDYVKSGFFARERVAGAEGARTSSSSCCRRIEDMTARVNAAVKPGMPAAETLAARRAAIAAIEDEAEKKTGLQSEIVTLYQGAQYHLYLYKKFTDVRLVFAPEFDAAFYGGDPDNFTFPRYALDMTLFRVYENGKPLADEALPAVVGGRRQGERAGVHVGPSRRDAAPEHGRAPRSSCAITRCRPTSRSTAACAMRSRRMASRDAEQERQAKDLFFVDRELAEVVARAAPGPAATRR